MTPKKEAAFKRKATPEPTPATTKPPIAGPSARATLNPAEFTATAAACWSADTISGVIACHAGSFITDPNPSKNVKNRSTQGPTKPVSVKIPRMPDANTIHPCAINNNRRRSIMSASAPAGRMTRKTGTVAAACTRLTISGDIVSCVISQPAPTFCIHVPVYEITAAIHSDRNKGSYKGAQAELARPGTGAGTVMLTDSAMLSCLKHPPTLPEHSPRKATRRFAMPEPGTQSPRQSGSPLHIELPYKDSAASPE